MDNAELPDRVSQILHHFTDLNQPSTSRGGLSSQVSFMPPTREEYIASPYTHTQCIPQMPSYPSSYQNCMPQSFTNPLGYSSGFTEYDSDDADADAGITVRDFINERKRKGHSDRVRDIKFLYFSVKSKKLIVLIYKLIIIIKNRSFQVTSAEESRCLYNPFGESILSQDSFWFMVKIVTRISVLCDFTNVLYIQNFIPSLQIGNLKEKGLKLILTLKDKVPPF
ncbi:hypothetical protein Anas_12951 [Armadillidium nasatum]|uniref:Uncharacterized protein n=1 Tax=Armadillidium nasatum TaxID=96803 RepID=A0A5N5TB20_9CRUS|nr:hypothetical protein Anas_12951 [Armadillidium nasatum]